MINYAYIDFDQLLHHLSYSRQLAGRIYSFNSVHTVSIFAVFSRIFRMILLKSDLADLLILGFCSLSSNSRRDTLIPCYS